MSVASTGAASAAIGAAIAVARDNTATSFFKRSSGRTGGVCRRACRFLPPSRYDRRGNLRAANANFTRLGNAQFSLAHENGPTADLDLRQLLPIPTQAHLQDRTASHRDALLVAEAVFARQRSVLGQIRVERTGGASRGRVLRYAGHRREHARVRAFLGLREEEDAV